MLSLEELQEQEFNEMYGCINSPLDDKTAVDKHMELSHAEYTGVVTHCEELSGRSERAGRVLREGSKQGYQPYV